MIWNKKKKNSKRNKSLTDIDAGVNVLLPKFQDDKKLFDETGNLNQLEISFDCEDDKTLVQRNWKKFSASLSTCVSHPFVPTAFEIKWISCTFTIYFQNDETYFHSCAQNFEQSTNIFKEKDYTVDKFLLIILLKIYLYINE